MVKLDDSKGLDDREFKELFGSLDAITASDELKESTLDFIFGQEEGEEPGKDDDRQERYPHLKVVGDGAMASGEESAHPEGRESDGLADAKEAQGDDVANSEEPEVVRQEAPTASGAGKGAGRAKARQRRKGGLRLKVAAAIVAVALVAGGGVAYATPANRVLVTVDDTTFDLGVNIFGSTVSAKANTDDGKAAIDAADVRNKGFGDACDRLLNAYEQHRGSKPGEMSLEVENRFGGGGDKIKEDVGDVMERHRERADPNSSESPAPSIPQGEEPTGGWEEPSQDSQSANNGSVGANGVPHDAEDQGGNFDAGPNGPDALRPEANEMGAPSNKGAASPGDGEMGAREQAGNDRMQESLTEEAPAQGQPGEGGMEPGQR